MILVAYMGFMYYVYHPREGKKYYLPEKYRGWVCITYEKEGAPPLDIEGDALIIKIPENGRLETSSRATIAYSEGYYVPTYSHYYYYSDKGSREAKTLALGGGFTIQKKGKREYTSYFWVSTEEDIKSDYEKYVKGRNLLKEPLCGSWIKSE